MRFHYYTPINNVNQSFTSQRKQQKDQSHKNDNEYNLNVPNTITADQHLTDKKEMSFATDNQENQIDKRKKELHNQKRKILEQIIQLDEQIQVLQDEKKEQENKKVKEEKKEKKANKKILNQDLERLYNQGCKIQDLKEKKIKKLKILEEQKQMEECIFRPKLYSKLKNRINGSMTERQQQWMKQKELNNQNKQQQQEYYVMREVIIDIQSKFKCTFTPNSDKRKNKSARLINNSDVYDRNIEWKQRIDEKKQRSKLLDKPNHSQILKTPKKTRREYSNKDFQSTIKQEDDLQKQYKELLRIFQSQKKQINLD